MKRELLNRPTFKEIPIGSQVHVSRATVPDGFEGTWYVVGIIRHGGLDYKLARHPEDSWEVIVHWSRVWADVVDHSIDQRTQP